MAEPSPSPAGPAPMIRHVPALDGLRGAAVLAVVLFHADGLLTGGYLGVDLFFVLSGYLITSILVAEREKHGRIALGRFWVRRARRLLPALLAIMPAVAVYGIVWAKHAELAGIRADALATLGYVANWHAIYTNKSYWDLFLAPSPLKHTWSLAIEEQFYVFFPLVAAFLLSRPARARALFWVTLGLGLASAALLVWRYDPGRTGRVYLGTDTRASGMLLGAALATRLSPETRIEGARGRTLGAAALVACALLGFAWVKLDGQDPKLYRGGFLVTELFCLTILAASVARPTSLVARFFSLAPLRAVGTISYGVYLWHWPVFVVMTPERVHVGPWLLLALRLVVTFAIALVSYRLLETPIRKNGVTFGRPWVIVPLSFVAAFAPVAIVTALPKSAARAAQIATSGYPSRYSVPARTLPEPEELRPGTLRVLTLGDSVAQFLGVALRHSQDDREVFIAERGVGSCSIFEEADRIVDGVRIEGSSCSRDWVADVEALRPDVTFFVLGGAFLTTKACDSDFRDAYQKRFGVLLDTMGSRAGKVIIALVPYPMGRWRAGNVPDRVVCFNSILTDFSRSRGLATLDLMGFVCPTKECNLLSKGEPIRPDGLHFDGVGAEETAAFTWREIRRIAGAPPRLDSGK